MMTIFEQELALIQQAIRTSAVGEKLATIERWQRFRSDETSEQWLELLGPTAVVLTHQEYFVQFVQQWVSELEELSLTQFVLGASVHDLGEAELGDIASPDKTASDEAQEVDLAVEAIRSLPLEKEQIRELIESYQTVVKGDNPALHYLFKSLEKTEYLDTAIHVFEQLNSGRAMEKGWLMIARVLAFDLPKVLTYAQALPNVVGKYLQSKTAQIDLMFAQSQTNVTEDFRPQFVVAQQNWQKFISLADERR